METVFIEQNPGSHPGSGLVCDLGLLGSQAPGFVPAVNHPLTPFLVASVGFVCLPQ